jgi:hypothetical protein
MNPVFNAALELQSVCQNQQWQFCFIGGVAVQRWGQPRFTADAVLTLLTGFSGDWLDVDTVVSRQWGKLNLGLVRSELAPLLELKGEPENMGRLEKVIARHTLKLP